jgi:glycosyltransferase involved in cell wall biosynthesis
LHQDYPLDRIEWIVIDDGTDKVGDLLKDIKQVQYFALDEKIPLGAKRNLMHKKAKGDIIVYMDDDDYYPCCRVSHAVQALLDNPTVNCVGCSELHIFIENEMYQFGPYGENHATAATFAFRKQLLETTSYDDNACLAEEKHFLKNYTIPLIQLDPTKTILVFSHLQNTFDKKKLLTPTSTFVKKSALTLKDFHIRDDCQKFFLEDLECLLENYTEGNVSNKPDVLKQMEEMRIERENRERAMRKKHIEEIMALNPLELANIYEKKMFDQMKLLNDTKRLLEEEQEKSKYLQLKISEIIAKSIEEKRNKLKNEIQKESLFIVDKRLLPKS